MEQVGVHPAFAPSASEQLLGILADPQATRAKLEELAKATEAHLKAAAEHGAKLQAAVEALSRTEQLSRHVESRHRGLDQREGECRRLKESTDKRAAALKEAEAQLAARVAAVEATLAGRESALARRWADVLRREQAVEAREGEVSTLKAQLDERAERMRKASA